MKTYPSEKGWSQVIAFISATNAITWLACLLLHHASGAGHVWAFWTFLFVTVWSPTFVAIAISLSFEGTRGIRKLLSLLFRPLSRNRFWYFIAVALPTAAVAIAVAVARQLHSGSQFYPLAALPFTIGLQLITGAVGEELGWRGFLLSHLQAKLSQRTSAILMGILWGLWHLPSFFFPGMPQKQMPSVAFLLMVAAFAIFLALLFVRTNGHILCTMLAHFSLNLSLAVGGARIDGVFLWSLASILSVVAIWSGANLSRQSP